MFVEWEAAVPAWTGTLSTRRPGVYKHSYNVEGQPVCAVCILGAVAAWSAVSANRIYTRGQAGLGGVVEVEVMVEVAVVVAAVCARWL